MLYYFLYPLSSSISFFNVFRYVTFRSLWALVTALLITIIFGQMFIRFLQRIKFGQYIQEDVKNHKSKAGTPTMGGLLIIFSVLISVLFWGDLQNTYVWLSIFVFLGFGLVGFLDDYIKVCRKNNKGLSAKAKFLCQVFIGSIVCYILVYKMNFSTTLTIPFFKNLNPDLGILFFPFSIIVLVGTSNGVNLTDGLDGLAIGPTIIAGICFTIFIYIAGSVSYSSYLALPYVAGVNEVSVFCGALVGASMGFLWFNAYPAQVFMGDVGSLSLGGILGFLAILAKQEILLIVIGGLFVIETISVMLQVGYFKISGGKRIFRMAPLHHHFEMKGIPESKIIIRFWILSALFGLIALSALKLR